MKFFHHFVQCIFVLNKTIVKSYIITNKSLKCKIIPACEAFNEWGQQLFYLTNVALLQFEF